jgi:hypothetical protein
MMFVKDRELIESLIKKEIKKVKYDDDPSLKTELHLKSFADACWDTYRAMSELIIEENSAYNLKINFDLDHWH